MKIVSLAPEVLYDVPDDEDQEGRHRRGAARGKDRGKRGRVIEALPKQRQASSSRTSTSIKRHQRPRPIQNSSRMGGPSIVPGGIIEQPAPLQVVERDGRLPDVQAGRRASARITKTVKDKTVRVRVCKNPECGQEIDK